MATAAKGTLREYQQRENVTANDGMAVLELVPTKGSAIVSAIELQQCLSEALRQTREVPIGRTVDNGNADAPQTLR